MEARLRGAAVLVLLLGILGPGPAQAGSTPGHVFTWGGNRHGQLGRPVTGDVPTQAQPTAIEVNCKAVQVAAGEAHSLALCHDGRVFSWGDNSFGQLGRQGDSGTPHLVLGTLEHVRVIAIAAGHFHSLAADEGGNVYSWGRSEGGVLGHAPTSGGMSSLPVKVPGLEGVRIGWLAAGARHSLALSDVGHVYSWGDNSHKQLGRGGTAHLPQPLGGELDGVRCVSIAAGEYHSVAATANGKAYSWGSNKDGELGQSLNTANPGFIVGLSSVKVQRVACGYEHTIALTTEGHTYSWGSNLRRQLGGPSNDPSHPSVIAAFNAVKVVSVAGGGNHSAAILKSGRVYTWGDDTDEQLGWNAVDGGEGNLPDTKAQGGSQPGAIMNEVFGSIALGKVHSLAVSGFRCPLDCDGSGTCVGDTCQCKQSDGGPACTFNQKDDDGHVFEFWQFILVGAGAVLLGILLGVLAKRHRDKKKHTLLGGDVY